MSESKLLNINAVVITRGDPPALPGRTVYPLFGRPLLAWVLDALKNSRRVGGVFVSSNDADVARVAAATDCVVIPRPDELDGDRADRVAILRHAVTWLYRERGVGTDVVLGVRATIPELRSADIDDAIEFLEGGRLREVVTVDAGDRQNDDFRVISARALFSTLLSSRLGVIRTGYVDVQSLDDIAALKERYAHRQRFDVVRD